MNDPKNVEWLLPHMVLCVPLLANRVKELYENEVNVLEALFWPAKSPQLNGKGLKIEFRYDVTYTVCSGDRERSGYMLKRNIFDNVAERIFFGKDKVGSLRDDFIA